MAICNFFGRMVTYPTRKGHWCKKCHKWRHHVTRLEFYDITYHVCPQCGGDLDI